MVSSAAAPRYAVYFAPAPDTALWQRASALLGYDAASGKDVAQEVPPEIPTAAWHTVTSDPRRYGFHATLKAPFRARQGCDAGDLIERLAWLAERHRRFEVQMRVGSLDGFAAVLPAVPSAELAALADAAVDAFEPLRADLTDDEVARRRPELLTARQRELLSLYGYPYVREQFRFHMTLTGRLSPDLSAVVDELAQRLAPALRMPTPIDRIALFRQETPQSRFTIIATRPLGSGEPL